MSPVLVEKKTVAERGDIRPLLNSCGTAPHGIAEINAPILALRIRTARFVPNSFCPGIADFRPETSILLWRKQNVARGCAELPAVMRKIPQPGPL